MVTLQKWKWKENETITNNHIETPHEGFLKADYTYNLCTASTYKSILIVPTTWDGVIVSVFYV